jgi:hypothetical protein
MNETRSCCVLAILVLTKNRFVIARQVREPGMATLITDCMRTTCHVRAYLSYFAAHPADAIKRAQNCSFRSARASAAPPTAAQRPAYIEATAALDLNIRRPLHALDRRHLKRRSALDRTHAPRGGTLISLIASALLLTPQAWRESLRGSSSRLPEASPCCP